MTVLNHCNVARIYEVGDWNGVIYAVMEYVEGENLYDLMKRNPRLHWGAAAELAREIVKGLVAAHAKNVMHLSLHPDRIFLSKGGQIKINFCNEGVITPSGEIAHYVAPELFLGKTLDAQSDIYSMGAIIYNIVTGKPPFAGKAPREVALKHREMAPSCPKYGVPDIPHSLALVVWRSLNKELKQRYKNAYELEAAINNFLLNDRGSYELQSYRELLPKMVEVSKSGQAFTQALNLERDKIKEKEVGTDTSEIAELKKSEEFEEDRIKTLKFETPADSGLKLTLFQKAVICATISIIVNLVLSVLLR